MTFSLISAALGFVEFAPTLVKWLSGNRDVEKIATQVVEIAKKVTQTSSSDDALKRLRENPDAAHHFHNEVLRLETEWEISLLEDRQRARERDLALLKAGHANKRADLMVVSAALGLVLCLLSLAFYSDMLPGEAVGIISTIAGIFGGCLKDAFAFEFGSSRGSRVKDSTVASMIERIGA
ncbi:MAG: hypothetical protein LBF66_01860 [Holosporales bacterium]|jgi:Flp pilus assembly protein TadB|nr:hypothetical protein [Holosporales bacterium]